MRKLERMGRRMFDWLVVLAVILSVYSPFNAVHANIREDTKTVRRCGVEAGQVLLFASYRDGGAPRETNLQAAKASTTDGHEEAVAKQVNFVYDFKQLSRRDLAIAWFSGCVERGVK
jgi:hypothetical protein